MVDEFRSIEIDDLARLAGKMPPPAFGDKPQLCWIAIDCLRLDTAYQRTIMERGRANVIKIAREFCWRKFGTLDVAEADKGTYRVVNGQHRAAAAKIRGIKDVPCSIMRATRAQQAEAFAAINGQVTAINAQQLHFARIVAGDPKALELRDVCARAGVTICPYPVPANKMKPGETLAVGALARALRLFGAEVLVMALSCVTRTQQGNVGYLRKSIINALCAALESEPEWQESRALLRVMERFSFSGAWQTAAQASIIERCSVESKLVDLISNHIETAMSKRGAA